MTCPPAVARGLTRVCTGMLAVLVVVAGAAWGLARQQLGATPADTRARIEAELRGHLAELGRELDRAVTPFAAEGTMVEAAAGGAADAVERLFARVAQRRGPGRDPAVAALTIYGADGTPLAWEGRPASLPTSRVTGPTATFLVSTPLGLRLLRLEPVLQATGRPAARRRGGGRGHALHRRGGAGRGGQSDGDRRPAGAGALRSGRAPRRRRDRLRRAGQ